MSARRLSGERAERLEAVASAEGLDSILVGDLVRPGDSSREAMADLIWLTGFTGTSGLAVVGSSRRDFVTDFRYTEVAAETLPDGFELRRAEERLIDEAAKSLAGRVGFDEEKTSVKALARLEEKVDKGVELVAIDGLLEQLRRVKDANEVEAIAAACQLSDQVFAELEQAGLAGRREREVANWIESRMRELGAVGPSFPAIVGGGPTGSRPHAESGEREIGAAELVVVDAGALLDGYCSDCTRTYASGTLPDEQLEVYELVLRAQLAALDAVAVGVSGVEVDAVAREIIKAGGHGERFGHGLGHGVGIEVHEAPRLSPRSKDTLGAGEVFSVEPGVYLPGEFGVRIEDLVALGVDGARVLTQRPKDLLVVG